MDTLEAALPLPGTVSAQFARKLRQRTKKPAICSGLLRWGRTAHCANQAIPGTEVQAPALAV